MNYLFYEMENHVRQHNLLIPIDILLVGATGAGKSSTLNALFGTTVAKVGEGVDPETQHISAHPLHKYIRFHDSAGLGDGKESDVQHAKNIIHQLLIPVGNEKFRSNGLIDIVLVILDGSSRDLGTTFKILENIVLKNITSDRVVVAVNQADMAMKGRYWNSIIYQPENELLNFLEDQSLSIQKRIRDSTGLLIKKPVYYSAKFGYNVKNLLNHLLAHFPTQRRILG